MKTANKTVWLLSIASVVLFVVQPCLADGVVFQGRDWGSLHTIKQNEQRAVIAHNNGFEKMLIAISLDLNDQNNAFWIFPVPGKPQDVNIDVVDSFPKISGTDPRVKAYEFFTNIRALALITQIYPAFTCMCLTTLSATREGFAFVHGSVEKWGIRAEKITADSTAALSNYLSHKKVSLDPNQLKPFERYLEGDYTLVTVWIDSKEQLLKQFPEYESADMERWPCIYVEFPAKKPFYPLIPTSAYSDQIITVNVVTLGYFVLDNDSNLPAGFWLSYYKQAKKLGKMPAQMAEVFPDKDIPYTRCRFHGPAKELTSDLWLKPTLPPGIDFAEKILEMSDDPFIWFGPILCYISLLSYASAGFAGLLLYRKWRGFDLLGFCNVFTIVAVYFASRWAKDLLAAQLQNSNKVFSIGKFLTVFSLIFVLLDYLSMLCVWFFMLN